VLAPLARFKCGYLVHASVGTEDRNQRAAGVGVAEFWKATLSFRSAAEEHLARLFGYVRQRAAGLLPYRA